jgi:6-phosphogluconolactonase
MNDDLVIDDPERLARVFARRVETEAARAIAERGVFSLAIPGGSAAETLLPALGEASLDWANVHVFWCDERAVPTHHPDSNYALARRLLLERVALRPERIHRMCAEVEAIGRSASEYEAELRRVAGDPPALDLALVGAGPDGHLCSLFAGQRALGERARLVVSVMNSPKPPQRRITLTLAALKLARLLVVAAFGKAKADVVQQALEEHRSQLPVALALRQAGERLVLLDAAAASRLRRAP